MYVIVIWKICYILKLWNLQLSKPWKYVLYIDTGNFGKIVIDFY